MDNDLAKREIRDSAKTFRYWIENGDRDVGRYMWDIMKELLKSMCVKFKFGSK